MRSGHERRQQPRINRRARVQYSCEGYTGYGTLMNLSEVGLFVTVERLCEIGSSISIPVKVASDKVVDLRGQIVWVCEIPGTPATGKTLTGIGIELTAAPEEFLSFVAKMRSHLDVAPRGIEERFDVFHKVRFESGREFLTEYTQNLSRGGMYLATDQPLDPGSKIHAQLQIPGIAEPLDLEGKVSFRLDPKRAKAYGRAAGCGIQFVNLGDSVRSKLHHYISRLEIHRTRPERRQNEKIPWKGSLSEYLVPELLLGLRDQQATGTLILRHNDIHKLVYMRKGQPFFVESSLESERLGHFLVRKGKISPADLDQSLESLAQSDVHHGEIMVAGGMLDAQALAAVLVDHQEEKLLTTFPWFEGEFEFTAGVDWPRNLLMVPLDVYHLVFQGISRWYDAVLLSSWMGLDENSPIRRLRMPPSDTIIPPHIFRILHLASSPQSLGKLAKKLQLSQDRVITAAYALIIAGWAVLDFTDQMDVSQPEFKPEPALVPAPENQGMLDLMRRWVAEDFERLRRLDFYELLGVDENAQEEVMSTAYRKCLERYTAPNIDKIEDEEIRTKIIQIQSWFRLAYETLRDPNLREYVKGRRMMLATASGQS